MLLILFVPLTVQSKSYYDPQGVIYKPSEEVIEAARQVYLADLKSETKAKNHACNCVLWAQTQGLDVSGYGAAKNYPINSKVPALQGFVVTYEGSLGHIAEYTLDGQDLVLTEANFVNCQITSGRRLSVSSPLIKGYIN